MKMEKGRYSDPGMSGYRSPKTWAIEYNMRNIICNSPYDDPEPTEEEIEPAF